MTGGGGNTKVVEEGRKDIWVERLPARRQGNSHRQGGGRGVHVAPAVDPAEQEFRERFGNGGRRLAEPKKGGKGSYGEAMVRRDGCCLIGCRAGDMARPPASEARWVACRDHPSSMIALCPTVEP